MKITLSIQELNCFVKESRKYERSSYNDGLMAKNFKDSGVNKLFLIGLTEFSSENYHNLSIMWNLLHLIDFFDGNISTSIAADLKLLNILVGLGSHSSSYPCTWCLAHKDQLFITGKLRTIGECIDNYKSWEKNGSKKQECKNFKSCSNIPLISSQREKKIIELIPPPELHLLIGVVNTIYDKMLKNFDDICKLWIEKCNVEREILYGSEGFAGNDCYTLISKIDILREICTSKCNFACLPYVNCLDKFRCVVDSCFTIDLKPDYQKKIGAFRESYIDLGINVTPKVHAIFFHIEDFCKISDKGLGYYSEQAVESAHADFKKIWKKYKVKKSNPKYSENLLKAGREYNSKHL